MSSRRSIAVVSAAVGTALVLGVVALLTGRFSGGAAEDLTAAPADATAPAAAVQAVDAQLRGVGTPLGHGFSVVAGTRLVGRVFPIANRPYVENGVTHIPSGWTAQLLVEGDALSGFNAYVAQARAAGYPVWGGCEALAGGRWVDLAQTTRATLVRCEAEYYRVSADRSAMLRVAIQLMAGNYRGTAASHLGIRYYAEGSGAGSDQRFRGGPPLAAISAPMPGLTTVGPRSLARAGQPIAPGLSDRASLRAPPSARVVATPSYGPGCTSGYEAVLAADDIDAAVADMRSQLGAVTGVPPRENRAAVGSDRVTVFETDGGGDTRAVVTAVATGKRGQILVASC